MLASRLLSILMLLQARGRASARELAQEFEVAVRTIHRDIDELGAAGIPVYAERGRNGGFRLRDGWRTKLTGLSESEAETLFLAGLPGPAAELGFAKAVSTARLKLLAALPPTLASITLSSSLADNTSAPLVAPDDDRSKSINDFTWCVLDEPGLATASSVPKFVGPNRKLLKFDVPNA